MGEYAANAPDELYIDPAMVMPPGGAPVTYALEVCYCGPQKNAERALAPLRKLGKPDNDTIKAKDYIEVQRANDTGDSRSLGTYLKGGFITQVPDKLVSAMVDGFEGDPDRVTMLFFQHCGGACGRQAESATAFSQRDALANMMAVAGWRLGVEDPPNTSTRRAATGRRSNRSRAGSTSTTWRAKSPRRTSTQLSRQLRPAGEAQEEVRPDQPVPVERERAAYLKPNSGGNTTTTNAAHTEYTGR